MIRRSLYSVTRRNRFVFVTTAATVVAGVVASVALAVSATYPPAGWTYLSPGYGIASNFDNCTYYYFQIQDNQFFKDSAKLGRSAVILTDGSWVASAQDTTTDTVAYTPSSYLYSTKKGYIKNTSTSAYNGIGQLDSNLQCY